VQRTSFSEEVSVMRRRPSIIPLAIVATIAIGCGDRASPTGPSEPAASSAPLAAPIVQAVTISGSGQTMALPIGQAAQLKATAQMADGSSVDVSGSAIWSSDNAAVATVSTSGMVTANGAGSAAITARYLSATGTFTMAVREPEVAVPSAGAPTTPPAPTPTPGTGTPPTVPGTGGPTPPAGTGTPPTSPPSAPSDPTTPPPTSTPCAGPLPVTPPSPLPPCVTLPKTP
jgi:hypothetical protein